MPVPDPICPECGAAAKIDFSGLMYCQGKVTATAEVVHKAEQELKQAISDGENVKALDKQFRSLSAQNCCGQTSFLDTDGLWKRVVANV